MEATAKRGGGHCGSELTERLPQSILLEILAKLDLESLCSAAPVCRPFRLLAAEALSSITTLDLSAFSPDCGILHRVLKDNKVIQSLTIDCRQLEDSSVKVFARESLQELILLKAHLFSSRVFITIGEMCPNIRLLMLEMLLCHGIESFNDCERNVAQMLEKCLQLEVLRVKFLGHDANPHDIGKIALFPPKMIKVLLLQPTSERHAKLFLESMNAFRDSFGPTAQLGISAFPEPVYIRLQSLSLVLDRITDILLYSIVQNLRLLTELCLEDRPVDEPSLHHDLTNSGLQSLGSCTHLTHLSLSRNRHFYTVTFRRVNDMGMFLLSEGCQNLESIRLAGFSRVTDAGYGSLLYSCKKLKRFEVVNTAFLSDLAFFYDLDAPCSLIDVRLVSCSKLTSEAAKSLSLCGSLEVLNLSGCKSIADSGLCSISKLCRLSTLDLGGADITDDGLSVLGDSSSPITSLCLRNCKRVTDKGVASLLRGDGIISKTLLALDLGCLPGISDRAIYTIAEVCRGIEDLCIRYCYSITDASISVLGSLKEQRNERRSLRRLDLFHCNGLSVNSIPLLCRPYFRGLRWLGVGSTTLSNRSNNDFVKISQDRSWINVCLYGCEMGCKDGWQFHGFVETVSAARRHFV